MTLGSPARGGAPLATHSFAALGLRPFAGLVPCQVPFDLLVKGGRLAAQGLAAVLNHEKLLVAELQMARLGFERNNVLFHLGITTEKVYSN